MILCNTGGEREKNGYLGLLLEKGRQLVLGVLFQGKDSNAHILRLLTLPIVMLNSHLEGRIFSVVCDDTEALSKVVESLVENGHKNSICL